MCVCVSNQKRNSSTTTTHTHVERIAIEVRVQKRGNNGVKLLLFSKKMRNTTILDVQFSI